ncbi:hypothetical protein DM02DRAFT_432993 [Periconia macrospinosa]|uniref:Uncharacterized protein n=1 Tax=Periconia macrospinosa TaxID=97972 RepID=A0A2V1CY34_9PLEO|nr:hypothetical protein DM02DRAFT_432993 [Periconia macrospinosa]
MGMSDRMHDVNRRLFIHLLSFPIILFYTLSLTGCISSSPGIPNIFTLKLEHAFHSPSSPEIRIGYFALGH